MRPGPPPKPPELKLLQGNPGHRPLAAGKIRPPAGADCPDFLSDVAKEEWARLYPIMMTLGVITQVDRAALAGLCQAWSNFRYATELIAEHGMITEGGNGTIVQHPAVIIQKKALENIRQFAAEFGFTPSARGRVLLPGAGEDRNDDEARFFGPRAVPTPAPPRPRRQRRARKPPV